MRIVVLVIDDADAENDLKAAVLRAQDYGADRQIAQLLARSADKIHFISSAPTPRPQLKVRKD